MQKFLFSHDAAHVSFTHLVNLKSFFVDQAPVLRTKKGQKPDQRESCVKVYIVNFNKCY